MLRYPDEFNTPTFPAGPRIALARVMAIATMIVFALIIAVGGGIYWASQLQHIHPFLVTVDNITGTWQLVGHDHGERTITTNRAIQESVIAHFTKNWFTVSAHPAENEDMWYGFSDRAECNTSSSLARAQIFCASNGTLYKHFIQDIVPNYQTLVQDGEVWSIDLNNIHLSEINVTDDGGTWKVLTQVDSNKYNPIQVIAYITLKHDNSDETQYMGTYGFYVTSFNAYNIGN